MSKSFFEFLYRNPVRVYLLCAVGGFSLAVSIFYIRVQDDMNHYQAQFGRQLAYKVSEFNQRYQTLENQLDSITALSVDFLNKEKSTKSVLDSDIVRSWRQRSGTKFRYIHGAKDSAHSSVEVVALGDQSVSASSVIKRNIEWFERELRMTEYLWLSLPFLFNSSPYIERVYYTSFGALTAIYPRVDREEFFVQLEDNFELGLTLPFYTAGTVGQNPNQKHFITEIYEDPISGQQTITIGMPLVIDNTHLGNFGIDFNVDKLVELFPQNPPAKTALVLKNQSYISSEHDRVPEKIIELVAQFNGRQGTVTADGYSITYHALNNHLGTIIMWLPSRELLVYALYSNALLFLAVLCVGFICFAIGLIAIKTSLNRLNGTLKALDEIAHRDALTNIANRRYFLDSAEDEYANACRHESSFSLILLDLDHFKKINDLHGHLAGDAVLKTFCQVLNENMCHSDLFARWGGEEFIVLPSSHNQVFELAEKLRMAVENFDFPNVINVTVSVGVVHCVNAAKYSKNSLFEIADKALYRAKREGRNNVVMETV